MDVQSNRAKFNSRLGNIERMVEFENLLTAKDGYKKSAREEKNFSYLSFPQHLYRDLYSSLMVVTAVVILAVPRFQSTWHCFISWYSAMLDDMSLHKG